MFTGVRAVAVYVTDKERAKAFYVECLGFEVVVDLGPDLCFLRSPNGGVRIYLKGGMRPASVDNDSVRLSFFLQAASSAAETFTSLEAAGVKMLQERPEEVSDDLACFQVLDPDGNILEVCGSL